MLVKSIKLFLFEKKIQAARASSEYQNKSKEYKEPLTSSSEIASAIGSKESK